MLCLGTAHDLHPTSDTQSTMPKVLHGNAPVYSRLPVYLRLVCLSLSEGEAMVGTGAE